MPRSRTPRRGIYPYFSTTDNETSGGRFLPMVTPEKMRKQALFGIPLKSSFTNEEVSDEQIQVYIDEAISEVEHILDLYIEPQTFSDRYDFRRHGFTWNYNYIKLRHPNVLCVEKVQLSFTNEDQVEEPEKDIDCTGQEFAGRSGATPLIDFPIEHVHVLPQEGVVQLVPAFGTSLSGFLISAFSGTQFHALRAIGINDFPGGLRIKYTCGFEKGKIPALIVGLIETIAAYRLLSILGPILFPHNSVGISIDGVSQSTSTPGPAFLAQRLNELEKIKNDLMDAAKGYYQRKFLIDYI